MADARVWLRVHTGDRSNWSVEHSDAEGRLQFEPVPEGPGVLLVWRTDHTGLADLEFPFDSVAAANPFDLTLPPAEPAR